ncbi:SUMF1/EgtB/PvdO family nonheme iron enzyme [Lewinella sp. JB7]|uniref:SUMF1/EgtB/PvdO family nonheme iron enzyme n=1 Tax=Lewinella sp. JB7 TaxID=2962887 RepID=UPI0020C95ACE|nr:SUMF1/EgtB/PvdO family nonheme iron enzyme [Lewinella sp. JB7]MCP9234817.1 SUMF1/EgtB/PvdO family nonheme iron enzyme [Lewinella sp. JB7]
MKSFLTILVLVAYATTGQANNIDVTNVTLGERNVVNGTRIIQFDVGWENSWRVSAAPANWDAAWIFIKFQEQDGTWSHATLSAATPGTSFTTTETTADSVGLFVYRTAEGSGNVAHNAIQAVWEYRSDGVDDSALVTVEVYAVEMVYVPQGSFYLGSDGSSLLEFYHHQSLLPLERDPYPVTSEGSIRIGALNGDLNFVGATYAGDLFGTLPVSFPKGYRAFYCMKYETSQQQYVKFFNTAGDAQKSLLDLAGLGTLCADLELFRNSFCWTGANEVTTSNPYIPVTFLSAGQMMAYLDWTGLRPMTELEYEKACRGPGYPIPDEYAWGNAEINLDHYQVTNQDAGNEGVVNADEISETKGNGLYLGNALRISLVPLQGPIRVGAFAGSGTRYTRLSSGGSYYGIMELSGNLGELVVTVGDPVGRLFSGAHGDGTLSSSGLPTVLDWPLSGTGYGSRGGSFALPRASLRVSSREFAVTNFTAGEVHGFRGVRTAPL